jgi:hypothetical protein
MNNFEKLQKHPLFIGCFPFHDRYCIRIKTPGQHLPSRVVAGSTLEEAAGLALITIRVTQK